METFYISKVSVKKNFFLEEVYDTNVVGYLYSIEIRYRNKILGICFFQIYR